MDHTLQRRRFMKGIFSLGALFSLGKMGIADSIQDDDALSKSYFINPAYSIRFSEESIFLKTSLSNGKIIEAEFGGIYSDVLKSIIQGNPLHDNIPHLTLKYNLSETYCRSKCDSILEIFEKECFIITQKTKISVIKKETDETSK